MWGLIKLREHRQGNPRYDLNLKLHLATTNRTLGIKWLIMFVFSMWCYNLLWYRNRIVPPTHWGLGIWLSWISLNLLLQNRVIKRERRTRKRTNSSIYGGGEEEEETQLPFGGVALSSHSFHSDGIITQGRGIAFSHVLGSISPKSQPVLPSVLIHRCREQ